MAGRDVLPGDSSLSLVGKSVVVTAGSTDLGRGIVEAFLGVGADVLTCAAQDCELGFDPIRGIDGLERVAHFVRLDVRDAEAARALIEAAHGRFGTVNVLVNCSVPRSDGESAEPNAIAAAVAENLFAPFFCSQAANALFQTQEEGGVIIHLGGGPSSNSGEAFAGDAAHAGLINLTATLALEWGPKVRVNCITTQISKGPNLEAESTAGAGPSSSPGDIESLCLFLASPLSAALNGANLIANGIRTPPGFDVPA